MKPVADSKRNKIPRMMTGQRIQRMHSLSCLEASQIPAVIMGMEHRSAMKFRVAIMLFATAIDEFGR